MIETYAIELTLGVKHICQLVKRLSYLYKIQIELMVQFIHKRSKSYNELEMVKILIPSKAKIMIDF